MHAPPLLQAPPVQGPPVAATPEPRVRFLKTESIASPSSLHTSIPPQPLQHRATPSCNQGSKSSSRDVRSSPAGRPNDEAVNPCSPHTALPDLLQHAYDPSCDQGSKSSTRNEQSSPAGRGKTVAALNPCSYHTAILQPLQHAYDPSFNQGSKSSTRNEQSSPAGRLNDEALLNPFSSPTALPQPRHVTTTMCELGSMHRSSSGCNPGVVPEGAAAEEEEMKIMGDEEDMKQHAAARGCARQLRK